MKQEEKTMILKINKRISVYRERYGRTVAEKIQQGKKKKKQQEPGYAITSVPFSPSQVQAILH